MGDGLLPVSMRMLLYFANMVDSNADRRQCCVNMPLYFHNICPLGRCDGMCSLEQLWRLVIVRWRCRLMLRREVGDSHSSAPNLNILDFDNKNILVINDVDSTINTFASVSRRGICTIVRQQDTEDA